MVVYAKHTRVSIHSTGHNLVLYLPEQQTTCTHASHSSGWPRCKRRPLRRRRVSDTMCRLGWPACTIHVPYLTLHARQRETAYHPPLSARELAVGKVSCRGTPAPAGHSHVHVHGQGTSGRRCRLLARLACDTEVQTPHTAHARVWRVWAQHLQSLDHFAKYFAECSSSNARAARPRTCCARSTGRVR
jgi:hypothetical protein